MMERIMHIQIKQENIQQFQVIFVSVLRTVVVAAISLAAVMILNLFVTIPGMTHLAFLMLVCGWITLGYGFFGGILTLMRR